MTTLAARWFFFHLNHIYPKNHVCRLFWEFLMHRPQGSQLILQVRVGYLESSLQEIHSFMNYSGNQDTVNIYSMRYEERRCNLSFFLKLWHCCLIDLLHSLNWSLGIKMAAINWAITEDDSCFSTVLSKQWGTAEWYCEKAESNPVTNPGVSELQCAWKVWEP